MYFFIYLFYSILPFHFCCSAAAVVLFFFHFLFYTVLSYSFMLLLWLLLIYSFLFKINFILFTFYFNFYFFGGGVWTQDLALVRQALYHLIHAPRPLLLLVILDLTFFAQGWPLIAILQLVAFHEAGIQRHMPPCPAIDSDWGLANFFLGLGSNHNLPNLCLPSSWVYKCISYHTWLYFHF
jgi:hypothetical protein